MSSGLSEEERADLKELAQHTELASAQWARRLLDLDAELNGGDRE